MALTITDKILLSLVPGSDESRERLNAVLTDNSHPIDWEDLYQRASGHQLIPLLRYNLAETGWMEELPARVATRLDEECRLWAARHLATVSETAKISVQLQSAGITAIPLKGAALMTGGCYAQAGLRTASDIDLLVDPSRIENARIVLLDQGYQTLPGRRDVRPRGRLPNEQNHLWPLRSPGGSIVELHHRAFHLTSLDRDYDFQEVSASAFYHMLDSGQSILLPAPHVLAIHLIHHTMIDLQSTHLSLRTMADLHAILQRQPEARDHLLQLADSFGVNNIVKAALDLSELLATGSISDLIDAESHSIYGVLLKMMLDNEADTLAETARILEYLDLSRHPWRKIGNLGAIIFTTGDHLDQLYGKPEYGRAMQYLIRPLDLLRRFPWKGLSPSALWRVRKLRGLSRRTGKAKRP